MIIKYANEKLEQQCTSLKEATKLFGGDKVLARSLLSRINAIQSAEVLKDIIMMPTFRFHNLQGDRAGTYAIDVKSRREKWRIIICPLDENEKLLGNNHIHEIAGRVKIVGITEVSAHYE